MVDVQMRNGGAEAASVTPVKDTDMESARRDGYAQSTIVKSSNGSEDMLPSKTNSKASSRRNSTQAVTSPDLRQSAQASNGTPAATEQPLQSQPMLAATSASSHEEPTIAPYGTRSRNRPGRSRINYAEDVEMDFEMAPAAANANTSEAQTRGSVATDSGQLPGVAGKKGSGAGQAQASWGNTAPTPKDNPPNVNIPGTSSFAANPSDSTAPAPKRRKNAANHAAHGNHANAAAPSQGGARRAHSAVVAANSTRESTIMTFEKTGAILQNGQLEADDGRTVAINDQVYLVCEPPGEPYYLCRVMEFQHANGDPKARVETLRVNWFYRPRDVQRYNNDTRLVYATMHSDICPITSLRGKCTILHRSKINDLDEYRKNKDSFWFNQLFDRFIHRWYDVIPVSQVINVPERVKRALDERWKYICLETSRVKELTSAVKSCKRCVGYCATNDSVECAVCHNTYHMNCVRPPLLKKPSRGFAWACGPCSRAQEKRLEARRTPLGSGNEEADEEEIVDEDEEDAGGDTTAPSPTDSEKQVDLHPGTQAEIALAKMWPMRYLGIHCRVEDALQYDDRAIYPRASSRLGPRHQANVNVWHGRPVEYVKPAEIKKRYGKAASNKSNPKPSKEAIAAMEAEKARRPKWVMDEPPGYIRRGEDYNNKDPKCTAELMFKMPPLGVHSTRGEDDSPTVTEAQVEAYMKRAKALAKDVGVESWSTNFLDKCLAFFTKTQYDADAALKLVKKLDRRKDLREPELTKEEEKRWNEGVAKYGSEIRNVRLHVKTMTYGDAVRYYYMWKKTPKGREIWGSYSNRKGRSKKVETDTQVKLLDDIADDQDDSAFDGAKATQRKRGFQCKFCSTRHSRRWRRAPGVSPGQTVAADGRASKSNSTGFVLALCHRCANLWRKYAVKWENTDEIAKKVAQGGGKAWKRRIDEELLREVYAAASDTTAMNGAPDYSDIQPLAVEPSIEPPKKRQKLAGTSAADSGTSTPVNEPVLKKKEKEKPPPPPKAPTPPPIPAEPRLRVLPCAVCRQTEGTRLECAACRLTVHKACYGIDEARHAKWFCDTCKNDKKESVSYSYECVLCPHRDVEQDLYEPPKVSHKKKTDRDREKERLEKELVDKARDEYRLKQLDKGRPIFPREPLKKTADDNWVHVYCALWVPETRFTNPSKLERVEGIGTPTLRYDLVCKICKTTDGACVSCLQCHAHFHVGCAHNAGYTFGIDVTPVKATRRDAVATVSINGETGTMTAGIWCKEHAPKTVIHPMNEEVEGTDLVALQLFAREFKQADLTLTGTARKANLVDQSTRVVPQAAAPAQTGRRTSTITGQTPRGRPSLSGPSIKQEDANEVPVPRPERKCVKCNINASPRWWKVEEEVPSLERAPASVDNHTTSNGNDLCGTTPLENGSHHEATSSFNGNGDYHMGDAPSVNSPEPPTKTVVGKGVSAIEAFHLCQKCHWKKLNAPEESPPREKTPAALPEPQQFPLQSPPLQPYAPPSGLLGAPWLPAVANIPPQHVPPLPLWHNGAPPPPPHLHNGVGHPLPPGPPHGHPPPYHSSYNPMHQPSVYPPFSDASVHALPPAQIRHSYPTAAAGPPPPLHLNNNGIMVNGMHSPRIPYSPSHPPGHSFRSTESPFSGPSSLPGYSTMHHGSPALAPVQMNNRPSTPRDTIMRDAPPVAPPLETRANTGASASPSLRNLLH